jgi:hypothetical protein
MSRYYEYGSAMQVEFQSTAVPAGSIPIGTVFPFEFNDDFFDSVLIQNGEAALGRGCQ